MSKVLFSTPSFVVPELKHVPYPLDNSGVDPDYGLLGPGFFTTTVLMLSPSPLFSILEVFKSVVPPSWLSALKHVPYALDNSVGDPPWVGVSSFFLSLVVLPQYQY